MPPKVIARPDRGVLPVNASARAPKPPATRLKLEIRRLPPGLTLVEFEDILGDEWKLGNGKVDWREYRQGKLKSPGKLPEQSRSYLHFKSDALISEFEARFLGVVFHDKAGTHRLSELKYLPPTLGFAPNQRTPLHTKRRVDNRQGTIDQDPEFIAFLEAETQPIAKPAALDASVEKERGDIKSTPLIDDLRERKANKAKAAASKAEREKEKKKTSTKSKEKEPEKEKDKEKEKEKEKQDTKTKEVREVKEVKDGKSTATKVERGPKQGAKILAKPVSKQPAQHTPSATPENKATLPEQATKSTARAAKEKKLAVNASPANNAPTSSTATSTNSAPPRQRQRGNNLEGIKKQLHKDLGVKATPASSSASSTEKPPSKPQTQPQTQQQQSTNAASASSTRPVSRSSNAAIAANKTLQITKATTPQTAHVPSTKAYLKHANPSQGMTEALIQQALSAYGAVDSVSIDSRKGTAVAVFGNHDGLKKAMEAKRVTVAEGAVEVLEFKERVAGAGAGTRSIAGGPTGGSRGGSRGGRGGRGGNRNAKAGPGDDVGKDPPNKSTPATTASTPIAAPIPAPPAAA